MQSKIVSFASGHRVELRAPTEAEGIAFADKREDAQNPERFPGDACDDGDEEVLSCVVGFQAPGEERQEGASARAKAEALLEDYPLAAAQLARVFRGLGGDDLPFAEDSALCTAELKKAHGARLIGLRFGHAPPPPPPQPPPEGEAPPEPLPPPVDTREVLVLKKLSRIGTKFLQQDLARQKRKMPSYAQYAQIGKDALVSLDKEAAAGLFARYPFLSMNLGVIVVSAASLLLEKTEGKP